MIINLRHDLDCYRCADSTAIKTIADCAQAGGGRVVVPPGKWHTGLIRFMAELVESLDNPQSDKGKLFYRNAEKILGVKI